MKVLAITQARLGSSRLPGKILKQVNGIPLLETHLIRIGKSKLIDKLIVATSTASTDDQLADFLSTNDRIFFRGDEQNVLDRFYNAALPYQPEYVVRLTSDCPLIDPVLIDKLIGFAMGKECDYVSNTLDCTFPDGEDIEVFTFRALEKAWKEAALDSEREHVTPYIWKNSSFKGKAPFTSANFRNETDFSAVRITLDHEADLLVLKQLIEKLGSEASWEEYASLYLSDPAIHGLNNAIERNMGLKKSEQNDKTH